MPKIQLMTPAEFFNATNDDVDHVEYDDEAYSMWLSTGKEYSPAIKLKIRKSLPNGAYKITYDNRNGEYVILPAEINTDEIYKFDDSITDTILKEVQDFWDRADIYKQHNVIHKRGLLLEGPAGNSKTSTINLLIKQLMQKDGLIFVVNNLKEFSDTFDCLTNVVRKIEPERPIITIIEDVDQLIAANGGNDGEFLDFLDGKHSINHHLVIMTSNDTSELSEAMLRPSRIDMRFVLEAPTFEIRKEFLKRKGVAEELLDEYATKTDGMSFAQLKEVFISTVIMGKDIDLTVNKILNPLECKDYLSNKHGAKLGL